MGWVTTSDLAAFQATAGSFLRDRPVHNTLLLSVSETMRTRGVAGTFGWWIADTGNHDVTGAFLRGAGRTPIVSALPAPAVDGFVELLATDPVGEDLEAISLDAGDARRFSTSWSARTGMTVVEERIDRLYHLPELIPPQPPPRGEARIATQRDRPLLLDWLAQFATELGMHNPVESMVDYRLGFGGWWLWEVDGEPVAVAGHTPRLSGMVRIGPVYTPPPTRRHGYAAAVTARVSATALANGAEHVLLFADLANPTSNGVYQRLGFRPVTDRVELHMDA